MLQTTLVPYILKTSAVVPVTVEQLPTIRAGRIEELDILVTFTRAKIRSLVVCVEISQDATNWFNLDNQADGPLSNAKPLQFELDVDGDQRIRLVDIDMEYLRICIKGTGSDNTGSEVSISAIAEVASA